MKKVFTGLILFLIVCMHGVSVVAQGSGDISAINQQTLNDINAAIASNNHDSFLYHVNKLSSRVEPVRKRDKYVKWLFGYRPELSLAELRELFAIVQWLAQMQRRKPYAEPLANLMFLLEEKVRTHPDMQKELREYEEQELEERKQHLEEGAMERRRREIEGFTKLLSLPGKGT